MIPLQDVNPTRRIPVLTYILIAINVIVFLWEESLTDQELFRVFTNDSVVPFLVTNDPVGVETALDFVRSMFFHGGWAHLLGNMLYLWVFGDNVEDRLGRVAFLVFYFAAGIGAALAQVAIEPDSQIPLVGASGAIAGVLGSYIVMFPNARIRGLLFFGYFVRVTELPAIIVLGFWFVLQLFSGIAGLGVQTSVGGGVAFFAHIGGFAAGVVLTLVARPLLSRTSPLHETDFGDWLDG